MTADQIKALIERKIEEADNALKNRGNELGIVSLTETVTLRVLLNEINQQEKL